MFRTDIFGTAIVYFNVFGSLNRNRNTSLMDMLSSIMKLRRAYFIYFVILLYFLLQVFLSFSVDCLMLWKIVLHSMGFMASMVTI